MNRAEKISALLAEVPESSRFLAPAEHQESHNPTRDGLIHPQGWLRFHMGQMDGWQSLKNLETAVSLLQTVQGTLEALDHLTQDTILMVQSAWLAADRDQPPPAEMNRYLGLKLDQMAEKAKSCRFHGRGLLDGQSGLVGLGQGVDFVRGGPDTHTAPPEGYAVNITQLPSRGLLMGGVPLHESWIQAETEIFVAEGERYMRYTPQGKLSVSQFLDELSASLRRAGLNMEVGLTRQKRLVIRHAQYGSQARFKGSSKQTPLLSRKPGRLDWNRRGKDIQGTLNGEPAFGVGRMLMGFMDNPRTAELAVAWTGGLEAGHSPLRCQVRQNGLAFQDGEEGTGSLSRLSLPSFLPQDLGRWVDTLSGFDSLAQVQATTWPQVLDTLYLLYAIAGEMEEWKERVAIWIERYQNRTFSLLRKGRLGLEPSHTWGPGANPEEMAVDFLRQLSHGQ